MATEPRNGGLTPTERKRLLIAQGALYRIGIRESRAEMQAGLSVEAIAKSALGHVAMGALSALKGGAIFKSGTLQLLLPLVISGISKLSKKTSLKSVGRGALIATAVALVTRLILRKRKARKAEESV